MAFNVGGLAGRFLALGEKAEIRERTIKIYRPIHEPANAAKGAN
jgi:hypothetical protein